MNIDYDIDQYLFINNHKDYKNLNLYMIIYNAIKKLSEWLEYLEWLEWLKILMYKWE